MSSSTIEKEIVQMVFEAKQFRKGIREAMEDLGEFKKSFDFDGAQTGLAELQKSSKIDFSSMTEGIASINAKMGVLGITAAAIITNIATSIMESGKKMAEALFITPAKQGLEEYETQLNAVQTILANTAKAGTTLDDVTDALNELNEYADLTIYNFTEMVDSIGKFTTAGVDLETSVAAIKGIANVAAISGANSQQAATAMYQLSQAISSGTVRLQDWISVENAGMGGVLFQDSLIETARVHGVAIDDMIEKNGSFRFSLQEGWLSSEIMLETLEKYTGDLTDVQLESLGYTAEQIESIQATAQLALDAATKVKTITALKDTMAEALGSGWSATWAIILGDFEEAKELWGAVAEFFGDIIEDSSKSRNALLEGWKLFGGRTIMIEGFFNLFEAGKNILSAVGEAFKDIFGSINSVDLLKITIAFRDFTERLKMGSIRIQRFKNFVRGLFAAFDIGLIVIKAILKPIREFLSGLIDIPGTGEILDLANSVGTAITNFREFAIETGFFDDIVADVIVRIGEFIDRVKNLGQEFLELDAVQYIIECFERLKKVDPSKLWEGFLKVLKAAITPFYLIAMGIKLLCEWLWELEAVQDAVEWIKELKWEDVVEGFTSMADGVKEFVDSIKDSELFGKFMLFFETFDGRRFTQFVDDAKEGFWYLPKIIEAVKKALRGLLGDDILGTVWSGIKGIGEVIGTGLGKVLDYLTENAGDIDYSGLFDVINKGLLGGILLSINKLLRGGLLEGLLGDDIGEGISDVLEGFGDTLGTFQNNIRADTLQKIAISIALLAGSIMLMTLIDSKKLGMATTAIVVMLGALFGASGAMRFVRTGDAIKGAVAIVGLSIALGIASIALRNVSNIDPERMTASLEAMAIGLGALVVSMNALSAKGGTGLVKTIGLLVGIGLALNILVIAIRKFGEMKPEVLSQGLIGITASLAMLVAAMTILSKVGDKNMLSAAAAIVVMSGALIILGISVRSFGDMDVDTLTQGLESIGITLAGFAVFSRLVRPRGMIQASLGITVMSAALLIMAVAVKSFAEITWEELLQGLAGMAGVLALLVISANLMSGAIGGAIATLIMSIAILALAGALTILAQLSWEELLIGLAAIAGVFILLGIAGYILTPVVPTLMLLGLAMLLIGAGAALFGLGLMLAATGLVAIAGSAAAIAAAIAIVGGAIIKLLPKIAVAIVEALANFLETMAEKMPIIVESMKTIILGMIGAVADLIPAMVVVVLDLLLAILTAVAEKLPDLIQAGYDILLAFLVGLRDNIPELLGVVLDLLLGILTTIAEKMPDLIQAGYDILLAFIQGISDNIAEVVTSAANVIVEFLSGIATAIPDIVDAGFDIITEFLTGVSDNIAEVVASGLNVLTEFIAGIEDGIPDLVDQAFSLILTFLEAIADSIEEYMPQIVTAGVRIGEGIVSGLVKAITDGLGAVKTAVFAIAKAALEALGLGFLWSSPSKKTYEIGEGFVQGFINAVTDGIRKTRKAMLEFAEAANKIIDIIGADIDKNVEFNPVIRPVLDLDNIDSGVLALNKSFNNSRVLAELSYNGRLTSGADSTVGVNGSNNGVTFIQNNYSPKALDRETIYRQTRTQVAKLSVKAFE